MKALPVTADAPLLKRLWVYQSERFPLGRTCALLVVFSAASVTVSSVLADRLLPGPGAYIMAFLVALVIFFQMRVADEHKDYEDDCRYRPERAVPRGLIGLPLLAGLAVGAGALALALVIGFAAPATVVALLLVWVWLALMTKEFWVPEWLKARPIVYLASHMAIMPLIDLLLTSFEWGESGAPAPGLWTFLALSFVNGCVLEIGRKLWAPEAEREGVETYSKLWGPQVAALVWLGFLVVAWALLVALGALTGVGLALMLVGGLGVAYAGRVAIAYGANPTPELQDKLDTAAGLWVVLCYAAAGLIPWIFGGAA